MKAKKKFLMMVESMPIKARKELVYNFTVNPMTINVIEHEIRHDTKLSKKILSDLGFEDESWRNHARTNTRSKRPGRNDIVLSTHLQARTLRLHERAKVDWTELKRWTKLY